MNDPDHKHELRSYGRRRGRKPSARQAMLLEDLLPRVALPIGEAAPKQLGSLFDPQVEDVWLEIGFGGGEHLVWQAKANPGVGLVGCEPFEDGIVKVLSAIDGEKLDNIRLHADDGRAVLRSLLGARIGRAFILFPDPWPKKRHHKRRLVSEETLRELARVMRPGAELRIATDIGDYARWMLQAVRAEGSFRWTAQRPQDWRARTPDWPQTRYEAKACREGRKRYYFCFRLGGDGRSVGG